MRFGGHETFALRTDWMPKGLALFESNPKAFSDPLVSDELGVGRNMVKSIWHWMGVTELVERTNGKGSHKFTEVGKVILKHDPNFLRKGTWWAMHINLVTDRARTLAWHWLFNHCTRDRFDRIGWLADFEHWMVTSGVRTVSQTTLTRDVACLLSCYAVKVPPEEVDPEDGNESPLRSLDLLMHMGKTDTYQMNRGEKDIPPEIVGYALAAYTGQDEGGHLELPLSKVFADICSPGRTLCLDLDSLGLALDGAERTLSKKQLRTSMLGAERSVQVQAKSRASWLEAFYRRFGA